MTIKPIRSEADHAAALKLAGSLMTRNDQNSIDQLEILHMLIERWEAPRLSPIMVTPAEAIRFRMEQGGLKPRDLAPYLGTKSRVSEILSGQRQPTVDQIRALNQHLGIPIASLIGPIRHEPPRRVSTVSQSAIDKLRSMGFIKPKETWDAFLARTTKLSPAMAMLRKTRTDRTNAKTDLAALEGWCGAVLLEAEKVELPVRRKKDLTAKDARQLAALSVHADWAARLRPAMTDLGVVLVFVEHLPGTFLDGAALCRRDGAPVIALTLRHDRLDNFWFTLLHEFAHVCCHLGPEASIILDDLEVSSSDQIEAEADAFAKNALIPDVLWSSKTSPDLSSQDVLDIAAEASVHPSIVAGRWRWENNDYRRFSRMLGRGEARTALIE